MAKRCTISVSAAFYARLKSASEERGVPIAQLVERAVNASDVLPVPLVPGPERPPVPRSLIGERVQQRDALRNAAPCQRVKPEVPVSEGMLSLLEDQCERQPGRTKGEIFGKAIDNTLDWFEALPAVACRNELARVREEWPDAGEVAA